MQGRLTAALLAIASACAAPRAAGLSPWPSVPLAALGFPRAATQAVEVTRDGTTQAFVARLESDAARLVLAGVAPAGPRLFRLERTAAGVTAEASELVPRELRPEYVLADLELAFAPLEALRVAFQGTEWTLEETARTRTLRRGGEVVAVVRRAADDAWAGPVEVESLRFGYRLRVETVERE